MGLLPGTVVHKPLPLTETWYLKNPAANVMSSITCTLCRKLYMGETGRRLGGRFREHLRDVEKDDKDAPNQSPGVSISQIILKNTCQFVALPYTIIPRTAAKI